MLLLHTLHTHEILYTSLGLWHTDTWEEKKTVKHWLTICLFPAIQTHFDSTDSNSQTSTSHMHTSTNPLPPTHPLLPHTQSSICKEFSLLGCVHEWSVDPLHIRHVSNLQCASDHLVHCNIQIHTMIKGWGKKGVSGGGGRGVLSCIYIYQPHQMHVSVPI